MSRDQVLFALVGVGFVSYLCGRVDGWIQALNDTKRIHQAIREERESLGRDWEGVK